MSDWKEQTGEMADKINHFLKVTRSYEPGLFHCYQVQGLPRTNNDLEQAFGQLRHHHLGVTGRKAAPASLVRAGISSALGCGCHSHSNVYCSRLWHDREWNVRPANVPSCKNIMLSAYNSVAFVVLLMSISRSLEAQFLQLALPH